MTESDDSIDRIVEAIPNDLLELWRKGPLMFASDKNLPVVELAGRMLTLRWGTDVICADIGDCHFRTGRPWKMKHNLRSARPLFPFGAHDLILIDFPPLQRTLFGRIWSYNTAAVGYTRQSLALWKTALSDAFGDSSASPVGLQGRAHRQTGW